MQKKLTIAACIIVAGLLLTLESKAQTAPINIVTTAVPFLRISPDARAGGMGDAGIATSPDANSAFWNLAKTPFAKTPTAIGATYTPWLKDIAPDVYLASISGYHQLDEQQAFSATIRYFNLGQIQFTSPEGFSEGTGRPREFGIDIGYSRKLTSKIAIGVALRYINSDLASGAITSDGVAYKAGNAVAADLSFFNDNTDETGAGFAWGIAITNLGSKIGYTDNAQSKDFIPANLGLGLAYTWVFQETSKFSLALDGNKLLVPSYPIGDTSPTAVPDYYNSSVFSSWFKSFSNNAYTFSAGAEYTYNDQFIVRAGYFFEPKDQGGRQFFTAGVGLKYNVFGFNFSYLAPSGSGITRNPLSNTLRFGILFDLAATSGQ
ncbi:MAG: type IX secretion system outer membrane channel protein PorV [Parafilimonas sp.]